MNITKEHSAILRGLLCPYCRKPTEWCSSREVYDKDYGMIYLCRPCNAWVGCHRKDPKKAKGRLANSQLRGLKIQAHNHFDKLWSTPGHISRTEAYRMLSLILNIPLQYTHIGMFSEKTCLKVIAWAQDILPVLREASQMKDEIFFKKLDNQK